MVVGISLLVALAGKSMVKAVISGALGLLISMVGIDPVAGAPRFTFGMDRLLDGVSFVAVIVGVFGLSELLSHRKGAADSLGSCTRTSVHCSPPGRNGAAAPPPWPAAPASASDSASSPA